VSPSLRVPPGQSKCLSHRATVRFGLLVLCLALLSSCAKVPLYSNLAEEEANEIMAHLMMKNIECTKLAGKEEAWILQVSPSDFPLAMQSLASVGLPREKFQKMGEIFQKSGLISSPTEERIRFINALSQEISSTLMQIDGVLSARVHVALPNNDPLSDKTTPPSAAIFIKYRAGYDIESATPDLKNLVTKSIEGLDFENVELVMSQGTNVEPPPKEIPKSWFDSLPPWGMPAASAAGGILLATVFFTILRKRSA
jgi:type III secretion protein J